MAGRAEEGRDKSGPYGLSTIQARAERLTPWSAAPSLAGGTGPQTPVRLAAHSSSGLKSRRRYPCYVYASVVKKTQNGSRGPVRGPVKGLRQTLGRSVKRTVKRLGGWASSLGTAKPHTEARQVIGRWHDGNG